MRCDRCQGCRSQWDLEPCPFCNFPGEESRTAEQIEADEIMMDELFPDED